MADLPQLPGVEFVETDAQAIIDEIISGFEEIAEVQLAPSDPRRLFLLSLAYVIVNQRQQIDAAGKSNLLYFAKGPFLDHLGAFRGVHRLEAAAAVTTLRFTLSAAQPSPVGIPTGTRATHDQALFWRTLEPATIPAGATFVDVPAEAMTPGEAGNGLAVGEISSLVDPIPFVAEVANTTVTQGGADEEKDVPYRERIYRAPSAFSTAGPAEAYVFWALSANQLIADVSATSPTPSVAEIRPLLQGGIIPGQDVLDQVEAVLSDQTIRPLADRVDVLAPEAVAYDVTVTYYIRRADAASEADIQARVQDAVDSYVAWQRGRLGRDIIPDELIARVVGAGAKRLVVAEPSFLSLAPHQVAQDVAVTVTYGGIEDE